MGALKKFLIPLSLILSLVVVFQNCGNSLHSNGDPYEIGGADDIISIDPDYRDDISKGPAMPAAGQTVLTSCSGATGAEITSMSVIDEGSVDRLTVIQRSGKVTKYSWGEDPNTLVINQALNSKVELVSVTIDGSRGEAHLNKSGVPVIEILSCK